MKLKKTLIAITICTIFTVANFATRGSASPTSSAISNLQNQVKILQQQLNEKNATIKRLQSQTSVQPLNIKFAFNGADLVNVVIK